MALLLEIITPEGTTLTSPADAVTLPTVDGQLTILPGHQPIIGQTTTGEVKYKNKAENRDFVVDSGFFVLQGDKLSLLVQGAADSAALDLQAIENAQARAQEALKSAQKMDPAEVEEFERVIRFSIAARLARQQRR